MSKLTQRFQKSRWSKTRKLIDAMKPGETLRLPISEYYNAKSSVERSNDAYGGERPKWTLHRHAYADCVVITHG